MSLISEQLSAKAQKIKLLLMDVDGVLTDGKMSYFPGIDGKLVEFKFFNSQDGLGFHFCNAVGLKTGVISGLDSPATTARAQILKISHIYQGHLQKEGIWSEILQKEKLDPERVAYIGDDFTDIALMNKAGLACAVANARAEVKAQAHYVTAARGGDGAVREIIELILRSQNLWDRILQKYKVLDNA